MFCNTVSHCKYEAMIDDVCTPRSDSRIVKIAKSWLNTPFHPQGRLKCVGCDCIGLILGIAEELGVVSIKYGNSLSLYDVHHYNFIKDGILLKKKMDEHFIKKSSHLPIEVGDILFFQFTVRQTHLAFVSSVVDGGRPRIIHSCLSAGKVVEHSMHELWLKKIAAKYVFLHN